MNTYTIPADATAEERQATLRAIQAALRAVLSRCSKQPGWLAGSQNT
jgi:hypothetical protein